LDHISPIGSKCVESKDVGGKPHAISSENSYIFKQRNYDLGYNS